MGRGGRRRLRCVAPSGAFRDEFNLPDVESRQGFDILDDHFGGQGTGAVGTIVFVADQGVDDPQVQAGMEELFAHVAEIDDVTGVESPTPRATSA